MAILRYERIQNLLDENIVPEDGQVTTWDASIQGWINRSATGGPTTASGNLDGGAPDSQYGGIPSIDGGTV